MAHLTGQDLQDVQYDMLWDLLSDNPNLPYSPIPSLNKALNTDNKNIIKAINEIFAKAKANDVTVTNFTNYFNGVIGDGILDPTLLTNLHKIDTNILKAVYKIYQEIVGDPDNPVDISQVGPNVKSAILELYNELQAFEARLLTVEEKLDDIEYKEDLSYNPEFPNILNLTYIANIRKIKLLINGIEYDENQDFTVDRQNKTITWLFNSSNNGFDLESTFDYSVLYYYEPEDNP